ncbi:MAG: hypothetical protein JRF45_06045 [Deltaproteobacteria bacterium]|nr:hypothetical protein [Deltaproteobacteria bacterium]MBW1968403.1 hypothetical protein [Deltaproteobacteria bacterium]MBW2196922.1 hypothetical protein [Deltaproteobacteria bacterium]MBW2226596.1 hypothetical protein [Deltaproteobacteria bacterium]MBW2326047.1 hypothetical protein [Deltaproteobacteria bacterium]
MTIPGNLKTTAMAVMPHKDADRALELALSMDIPFWPQLPHVSYYEDMYVQAAEHFPGILLDLENQTLRFSMDNFINEFEDAMARFDEPEYFDISRDYSVVYHKFLEMDLSDRPAIRGQLEGPISFGLNVLDQDKRPILFEDTIRPFMFEFMSKRINVQLKRLQLMNPNAFMFVDEPGLQFLFSALSGYDSTKAKSDMEQFFSVIQRPRGIHLCGNPDWDFLLHLDLDILSLDIYQNGEVFSSYWKSIKNFLDRDGVIVWGVVPTNFEPFEAENIRSLETRLTGVWDFLSAKGIDREFLLSRSLISPATCCLVNPDGETTVEKAFAVVNELSHRLRDRYKL